MIVSSNHVSVTYSDTGLRNLVEEYITQQRLEFSLKGVCSYILYWAVEDGKIIVPKALIESNELSNDDQGRVKQLLETIVTDGRIESITNEAYIKR